MEINHPVHRPGTAGCRLLSLPGAGLGHPHQRDHGVLFLFDRPVESACDHQAAMENVAVNVFLRLVYRRRLLLAVLAFQGPGGTRVNAAGKFPRLTVPVRYVRTGLVLPGESQGNGPGYQDLHNNGETQIKPFTPVCMAGTEKEEIVSWWASHPFTPPYGTT